MSETQPDGQVNLLFVCSANQCRSPLAEVIARDQLARLHIPAVVRSAGTFVREAAPAVPGAVAAAAKRGLDLREHVSQRVTDEVVAGSHLVLTMERRHVIDVVTDHGGHINRTFTLPEMVGYAEYAGSPRPDEYLQDWIDRITVFRDPSQLLGGPEAPPEVPDPIGGPNRMFRRTADELDRLLGILFRGIFGRGPAS